MLKELLTKCKLKQTECIINAISSYRDVNDWLNHFLSYSCETGYTLIEKSEELYTTYRFYCGIRDEYIRCTAVFYTALDLAGMKRHELKVILSGLLTILAKYRKES